MKQYQPGETSEQGYIVRNDHCPVCDSQEMEYAPLEIDGSKLHYPWVCMDCNSQGQEWHSLEFEGHNVKQEGIYVIPSLSYFKEGVIYEQIPDFTDGTVKTQEQYDNGVWEERVFTEGDRPYIERALNGINAQHGICGIRIKRI